VGPPAPVCLAGTAEARAACSACGACARAAGRAVSLATEHLLTLDGRWMYVSVDPRSEASDLAFVGKYLDDRAPGIMVARLPIHC
jgi:hypothetical protein